MKNKVLLVGGSLFTTMKYNELEFVPIYNSFVNKLNLIYDVVNMSVEDKNCSFFYNILNNILNNDNKYKKAFLYIGEAEAKEYNLDCDKFYNNYSKVLELLLANHIIPELYLIEDDNDNNVKVNNVIKSLADTYNLTLNYDLIRSSIKENSIYIPHFC